LIVSKEKIWEAKEKLGDQNAFVMADMLKLESFDERNLKAVCCFHQEDTPSLIYNPKNFTFHCFGCQKTIDIIDVLMSTGLTYLESVQKLFELANVKFSFGYAGVKTKKQYKYPKEIICSDKSNVIGYLGKRKISEKTINYADIREDDRKNIVFNFYDTNDVLTMVKYRPAKKLSKADVKCWCQKDADTSHLLFNMNRININMPLVITEGEIDALSVIESGYSNVVSIPLGAGNYQWIEENWDWLEQFEEIIICSDNDETGCKMQKEVIYRLGSWRTKVVVLPEFHESDIGKKTAIKDINEVLFFFGKDKVLDLIINAKDSPIDSVIDFSDIED
jgi:twinkle protein